MGTKPGDNMMGQLERRAEGISGEFKPQDIATTLALYRPLPSSVCDFLTVACSTVVFLADRPTSSSRPIMT
jgi:hypothetical protein